MAKLAAKPDGRKAGSKTTGGKPKVSKAAMTNSKKAATKKSFANMITVIRLHLTSYVELMAFIKDTYKAWRKTHNAAFAFSP